MHSPLFWIIFVENDEAMSDLEKIQLFENKKVRTAWDEEKQGVAEIVTFIRMGLEIPMVRRTVVVSTIKLYNSAARLIIIKRIVSYELFL